MGSIAMSVFLDSEFGAGTDVCVPQSHLEVR